MPAFDVSIDPRSIGDLQYGEHSSAPGTSLIYSSVVPEGINRLIFHASIYTDDVGASRRLALGLRNRQNVGVNIPCTLDGVDLVASMAGCHSNTRREIWVPSGFRLIAFLAGGAITAGKSVSMSYLYVDVLRI